MSGISRIFAADKSQQERINNDGLTPKGAMEHRYLGGLDVSTMALGCVDFCPVGYYGCRNEKNDIIKQMRR